MFSTLYRPLSFALILFFVVAICGCTGQSQNTVQELTEDEISRYEDGLAEGGGEGGGEDAIKP
ncbi:MAG: hypothetical protein AAF958_00890 [Planctomycetota bacterium]